MATLYVKDVPDSVYRALKERAKKSGRSLSAEVRQILQETVPPKRSRAEVVASIERLQRKIAREMKGKWLDPVQSIREDRDNRAGPSHRPYASSAPRERDRPADPNSPFAKLAALKEQLAANKDRQA